MPPVVPSLAAIQAVVPKSARAEKQREAKKKQRQERHNENEGSRSEDKRILNRTDFDKQAFRIVSIATLHSYARTIRLWCEFCEEVIHLSECDGMKYFQPHGLVPSTKMLRQFLYYVADSSTGRGPGGKITRRTAVDYATNFFGAYAYSNRKLEQEVRDQVLLWVQYDLTEELELNKQLGISKPIAHRADVSLIIKHLYSPLGLRQVLSMRVILHVGIFINLMMDTCGRIHEITSTEKYPEQYLRWEHLKVYAFNRGGRISLSAVLKVSGLKGMKDKPEQYKEYVLHLLPLKLWPEDTLRLLLLEALIDGHIVGTLEMPSSICYRSLS
jgi:hypothetical protein